MLGNDGRGGSCQRKATFSCFPLVFPPSSGSGPASPRAATGEKLVPLPLASVTLVILPQCKNIVKLSSLFRHFLSYLGLRGLQLLDPSAHWARIRSPCRPPLRLQTEIKEKNCYPHCFSPQNTVFRPIFYEYVVYGLGKPHYG